MHNGPRGRRNVTPSPPPPSSSFFGLWSGSWGARAYKGSRCSSWVDRAAVEGCFHGAMPEGDRPRVLNFTFAKTAGGHQARVLCFSPNVRTCCQKQGGTFPVCGIRPARFQPPPVLRRVLKSGRFWKGAKGGLSKGSGSKGGGRSTAKRVADRRASALSAEDGRQQKRVF